MTRHKKTSKTRHTLPPTFPSFRPVGMVGEACLPSNAYFLITPFILDHVCWSEYSDSSFVYGFISLDYGLGTMTTTNYFYFIYTRVIRCTSSTKKYLYKFDPLKPHFYKVKLGVSGVYIIFLISAQKQIVGTRKNRLGGAVLTSTPNLCFEQKYEKYLNFYLKTFSFWWLNCQYI